MMHALFKGCLGKIHTTKHFSRIPERTTIWLDWDNAFTGTKPATKANFLSIFNLLVQRVDSTKALDREGEKKVAASLTKYMFLILRAA